MLLKGFDYLIESYWFYRKRWVFIEYYYCYSST